MAIGQAAITHSCFLIAHKHASKLISQPEKQTASKTAMNITTILETSRQKGCEWGNKDSTRSL